MSFAQILPLAFVMIAGPQIVTAAFLATSPRWAANSIAYLTGAAISITTVVTITYLLARGTTSAAGIWHPGAGGHGHLTDSVVLALLLVLIAGIYLRRTTSGPPKWMSRLQTSGPKSAFVLGVALLGIPVDTVISIAVGLSVAHDAEPWRQCLPFVALTLLFLAVPALAVLVLGKRARLALPHIRDWMSHHGWVINEIILVFFAALIISSLLSG